MLREPNGSGLWKVSVKGWGHFLTRKQVTVRCGQLTRFWLDFLCGGTPLKDRVTLLFNLAKLEDTWVVGDC